MNPTPTRVPSPCRAPDGKAAAFAGRRVLQVATPSHLGGAEILLARLVPRLREEGCALRLVSNIGSRCLGPMRETMDEADFEVAALPIGGKCNLRALPALRRAVGEMNAQFTHTHLSSASWWGGWLAAAGICPSLGHVHGFTSVAWHHRQTHLIACSHAVKAHLVRQGIAAQRVSVIPNAVGPEDIEPRRSAEAVRLELGADRRTPVIGCFGHFQKQKKGWGELLAAMPLVLRQHPRAQFWCVGDGESRALHERQAALGGLSNSARFLGFRRDVADLMSAIDVMALPSHREPFGLVYLEAALLGKPTVGCRAGGVPEVVEHGETGLLVPPRDSAALADALVVLLDDPALARAMGQRGRERALDCFAWPAYLRALRPVYDAVASGR